MAVLRKKSFDLDIQERSCPRNQSAEVFRNFSGYSTLHGLSHTTDSRYGWKRRAIWILACLCTFAGLLYTVGVQVQGLLGHPTLTQIMLEMKHEMPFPAVTLCSLNKVRISQLEDDEDGLITLFMLTAGVLGPVDEASILKMNTSVITEELVNRVPHKLWPTLQKCTWGAVVMNCSDLFVTMKTDMGNCFTFNHRSSGLPAKMSKQTGNKYGLTIIANIQQDEYLLDSNTESAGLRVLLHGYNETPLVEGHGFDVAPGMVTKVALEMMAVKNLPPPYTTLDGSKCFEGKSPKSLELFEEYDLQACYFECRYNYVFSGCQCKNPYDPVNATTCDTIRLFTCYSPRMHFFMDNDMYKQCSCPMPCEWEIYKTRLSMAQYPSLAMLKLANETFSVNLTEDEFRRNYLKLSIGYDQFLMETVQQVPKFTPESIISTFGGQMGMFLGASILSLLEFLEFLLQLIVARFQRRTVGSKDDQVTSK